jgi:hypothetical protein
MGLKKISTTSVLETGKIWPLTVPYGGVVLSRPRPTLNCSACDDDDDDDDDVCVSVFAYNSRTDISICTKFGMLIP